MKTSEDGLVIEFEKGEEIILDREYEWIDATDFANRSLGRSIMIRGLKASKSDLEKFIELYRNVGIEVEPMLWDTNSGEQRIEIALQKMTQLKPGYDSYVRYHVFFDRDGKFIQQGIWE